MKVTANDAAKAKRNTQLAAKNAGASAKCKPARPPSQIENIMTNDVSIPIPDSIPRKSRIEKAKTKGFVQTVKDDFHSTLKAVGKFVRKVGSDVPPSKKRNKAGIIPPFSSPI